MKLTSRTRRPWVELAELDYFRDVPTDRLRALNRHADRVDVRAGTRLQQAGRHVNWVWVPVHGALALQRDGERVGSVLPGEGFGETEVLLHVPATTDVVAATDGSFVSIPANAFEGLMATPEFGANVARRLARRIAVPALVPGLTG